MTTIITVEVPEEYADDLKDLCCALKLSKEVFTWHLIVNHLELNEALSEEVDVQNAENAAEECRKHPDLIVSHEEVKSGL